MPAESVYTMLHQITQNRHAQQMLSTARPVSFRLGSLASCWTTAPITPEHWLSWLGMVGNWEPTNIWGASLKNPALCYDKHVGRPLKQPSLSTLVPAYPTLNDSSSPGSKVSSWDWEPEFLQTLLDFQIPPALSPHAQRSGMMDGSKSTVKSRGLQAMISRASGKKSFSMTWRSQGLELECSVSREICVATR